MDSGLINFQEHAANSQQDLAHSEFAESGPAQSLHRIGSVIVTDRNPDHADAIVPTRPLDKLILGVRIDHGVVVQQLNEITVTLEQREPESDLVHSGKNPDSRRSEE
jgi:hypothetical protein